MRVNGKKGPEVNDVVTLQHAADLARQILAATVADLLELAEDRQLIGEQELLPHRRRHLVEVLHPNAPTTRTTGESGRRPVSGLLKRAALDDEASAHVLRLSLATTCARRRGEDVENRRPAPTL